MLRWLILLGTFAAWSTSLVLVVVYCRPAPIPPDALANQQTLEYLFSDKASSYSSWRVYLNLRDLHPPGEGKNPAVSDPQLQLMELMALGQGAEPGELEVGYMVSTVKKRDAATVEVASAMKMQVPPGHTSALIDMLSPMIFDARSSFSLDDGIIDMFARMSFGDKLEAQATGFKERDKLRLTQTLFSREKAIGEMSMELPAKDMCSPSASPVPFTDRPPVKAGQSWPIILVDALRSSERPRLLHGQARVRGMTKIRYRGREEDAFLVEAELDGKICLGWYAASGRLLKQHFRALDIVDVTIIRSDTDEPDPALPEPGWGKIFPKREKSESSRAIESRLGS